MGKIYGKLKLGDKVKWNRFSSAFGEIVSTDGYGEWGIEYLDGYYIRFNGEEDLIKVNKNKLVTKINGNLSNKVRFIEKNKICEYICNYYDLMVINPRCGFNKGIILVNQDFGEDDDNFGSFEMEKMIKNNDEEEYRKDIGCFFTHDEFFEEYYDCFVLLHTKEEAQESDGWLNEDIRNTLFNAAN